jgi:hypothetical protein
MIPLNEGHLRQILKEWTRHYNRGRPHRSLGPGIPEQIGPKIELQTQCHQIPIGHLVVRTTILSGLHHEYGLEKIAA